MVGIVGERRTARRDHDRIEDDRQVWLFGSQLLRRFATCSAAKALPIMPIFTASTPMSRDDRVDLRENHFGRNRMHRRNARACSAR